MPAAFQNPLGLKHIFWALPIMLLGIWWLWSSDESRLKKQSRQLLAQLAPSPTPLPDTAIVMRTHKISRSLHVLVEYDIKIGDKKLHKKSSLTDIKGKLFSYFKQKLSHIITIPSKKDIIVKIKKTENKKTADLNFPLGLKHKDKKLSCKAFLHWVKNKNWRIHKIRIFDCTTTKL